MEPNDVGQSYDAIAHRWDSPDYPLNGLPQIERALKFVEARGTALDVGCGCNDRVMNFLKSAGFQLDGVDVSEQMITLARRRFENDRFYHADICQWSLPRAYDFVVAWDSIWHVPLDRQPSVLRKLCEGLAPKGVFIFTMGGLDEPHEVRDSNMGVPMYHATIGIPQMLKLVDESNCIVRHLEFDQWPEKHLVVIVQKRGTI